MRTAILRCHAAEVYISVSINFFRKSQKTASKLQFKHFLLWQKLK